MKRAEAEADFREFVATRWVPLVRFGALLTGDVGHGEDLVQAALERCWPRWRSIDSPERYVRTAMANLAASAGRRRRWREIALPLDAGEQGAVADAGADLAERDQLWRLLRDLPPRMRAVVVLRYVEDLSEADTATALGCSVGTVKSQGAHGLRKLREALRRNALHEGQEAIS